ncbi:MAG: DUF4129 domain-containing protein [Candidatus Sumerlaeaceae bacterium]|nr:DUF4129 domain-containing protein [Candidatus Sumerlaeaceae bacterium]
MMDGKPLSISPETQFQFGAYAGAWALGTYTAAMTMLALGWDIPLTICFAAPAIVLGLLLTVVAPGRHYIADFVRTFSPNEKAAYVALCIGIFLSPSLFARQWMPHAGLMVVLIPFAATLASPGAFAQFVVLCGITFALISVRFTEQQAFVFLAIFMLLVCVCLAYEFYFFTTEAVPVLHPPDPWTPLAVAFKRFGLTVLVTAPWVAVIPTLRPVGIPRGIAGFRDRVPVARNLDAASMSSVELFYTFFSMIVVLALTILLIKLVQKLRRPKSQELMPESIGVPMGSPETVLRQTKKPTHLSATDPRATVIEWYRRLSIRLGALGLPRLASETPLEYQTELMKQPVIDGREIREVTGGFMRARYSAEEIAANDADAFAATVKSLLNQLDGEIPLADSRKRRTTESGN